MLLKPVYLIAGARSRRPQSSPNQPVSQWQVEGVLLLVGGRQRPFRLQSSSLTHVYAMASPTDQRVQVIRYPKSISTSCEPCGRCVDSTISHISEFFGCGESVADFAKMEADKPKMLSR